MPDQIEPKLTPRDVTRDEFREIAREVKWKEKTIDLFLDRPPPVHDFVPCGTWALRVIDWPWR